MTVRSTSDLSELRALLDWAYDVSVRVRDHHFAHADKLTEEYAARNHALIVALNDALDARDAPAIRSAVEAYGALLNHIPS